MSDTEYVTYLARLWRDQCASGGGEVRDGNFDEAVVGMFLFYVV